MISAARPTPNEIADRLTGRSYLSYSAINTYRACPLRYRFRYLDGLPEASVSASLVFGSAIHRAAQLHFDRLLIGEPPPRSDEMLMAYQDAWHDQLEVTQVRFSKGDDADSLNSLAGRVLDAFCASPAAQPLGRILGVEEELLGAILPGIPDVLGRIDLLTETDDAVVITDVKTSRSRWSRNQAEEATEQLLLYSELVKPLVPGKRIRLRFIVLTKTKGPIVDIHDLPTEPQRVKRILRIVERVWRAIESDSFYPTPSPMQCTTCPYRGPCRQWPG